MPYLPSTVSFPEPGTFVRYWDKQAKQYKFQRLVDRRFPYVYPRRLQSVAPGSTSNLLQLREIDPAENTDHRYMAYIGVKGGHKVQVFHPFDVRLLQWDESITEIDLDQTAFIDYQSSPYEAPSFFIWVEPQKFPAFKAINVTNKTGSAEIIIMAAVYSIQGEDKIQPEILDALKQDKILSLPINYGGTL